MQWKSFYFVSLSGVEDWKNKRLKRKARLFCMAIVLEKRHAKIKKNFVKDITIFRYFIWLLQSACFSGFYNFKIRKLTNPKASKLRVCWTACCTFVSGCFPLRNLLFKRFLCFALFCKWNIKPKNRRIYYRSQNCRMAEKTRKFHQTWWTFCSNRNR